MADEKKQHRLDKVRMVARILGGSEHGHLHRTDKCCGRCCNFTYPDGSTSEWFGVCTMRRLPQCPKVEIPYNRPVCKFYDERPDAMQCWEIIPEAHR